MDNMHGYSKFEVARLIGARALQISMGAPYLVKLSGKDLESIGFNPIEIAKREFAKDVIPMTIVRPVPDKVQIEE